MKDAVYLSIITPCYNGEKHIESAIQSVLNQPAQGIELIVINDGSTDKTGEICEMYSSKIRYIQSENKGAGHARNIGIQLARGKWIAFLDSDDLLVSNCFTDSAFSWLKQLEDSIDVIYTPWIYTDMDLKYKIYIENAEQPDQIEHIPNHEFWTCIYSRQFLLEHNILFYEYKEQDIATAFRYRVFSQSPRVETRNDFLFLVQRNNPQSNTNTWKYQTMHCIKAMVYYDLFENYANEYSKTWLFDVAAEQMRLYYGHVLKDGYSSEKEKRYMQKLVKACIKQKAELTRSFQNIKYVYASAVIDKFARNNTNVNAVKTHGHSETQRENTDLIIGRLKKLSDFLHS